jgi:cell shape-determining protein MreC
VFDLLDKEQEDLTAAITARQAACRAAVDSGDPILLKTMLEEGERLKRRLSCLQHELRQIYSLAADQQMWLRTLSSTQNESAI